MTYHFISPGWYDQGAKRPGRHKVRFFLTLLVFIVILLGAFICLMHRKAIESLIGGLCAAIASFFSSVVPRIKARNG